MKHPPRHDFGVPGKGVPASEQTAPLQHQTQGFRRPIRPHRHQIRQPGEVVQGFGKGARGAGAIPRIPADTNGHGRVSQGNGAGQDEAPGVWIRRTSIYRLQGKPLGSRALGQPAMRI